MELPVLLPIYITCFLVRIRIGVEILVDCRHKFVYHQASVDIRRSDTWVLPSINLGTDEIFHGNGRSDTCVSYDTVIFADKRWQSKYDCFSRTLSTLSQQTEFLFSMQADIQVTTSFTISLAKLLRIIGILIRMLRTGMKSMCSLLRQSK